MLRRRANFWLLCAALLLPLTAQALQEPRPISTDSRIRTVRYSENEVYQFIGHYGFQSTIEFDPEEKILTVSVGDSVAWQINPSGNRLFLKPIDQNALTNMTVITDRHSYLFELHAEETQNIRDKELVFVLRFIYPQSDAIDVGVTQLEETPEPEKHPERYNFSYTIRGSSQIEPVRIFDDGQFTFFEFRDSKVDVPAIFRVTSDLKEELVNFRKRGDYIVVERVAPRFTLRRGSDILCVYNERIPLPPPVTPERTNYQRLKDNLPF